MSKEGPAGKGGAAVPSGDTRRDEPSVTAVAGLWPGKPGQMLGKPAAVPAQQGGQVIIRRVTYSLGGQAVATRVTGDPVSGNNGVFYTHTDHPSAA